MQKNPKNTALIIKALIVALALGNLIFLFVFNYQLPGFLRFSSKKETSSQESEDLQTATDENDTTSSAESSWTIQVPSEALNYDGTTELNLDDGVTVLDASGTEQNVDVFTTIMAGESAGKKIVEYSVTDADGNRITARRDLILSNYSGPSITLLGEIPEMESEEVPNLITHLTSSQLLFANDGFGNDITSSTTAAITNEDDENGEYTVTLSITNMFNDTFSTEVVVNIPTSGPVIKLNTSEVTLKVGENFSFYKYIEYARDEEGNSLSGNISMQGSVDTSTPGTYELEFYCSDSKGNISPRKKLTVIVEQ